MHGLQNSQQYDETNYRRPEGLELIWAQDEPWNDGTTLVEYERNTKDGTIWRVVQGVRRFYCMPPAWQYSPVGSQMTECGGCYEKIKVAEWLDHERQCGACHAIDEQVEILIEMQRLGV